MVCALKPTMATDVSVNTATKVSTVKVWCKNSFVIRVILQQVILSYSKRVYCSDNLGLLQKKNIANRTHARMAEHVLLTRMTTCVGAWKDTEGKTANVRKSKRLCDLLVLPLDFSS